MQEVTGPLGSSMSETLFTNARIFDGSGRPSFSGEVLVTGDRIAAVMPAAGGIDRTGRKVVDGRGCTLMPGLIEPHAHLTFTSSVERIILPRRMSADELAQVAADNARVMLDHGFTSVYSAGGFAGPIELALKRRIDAGAIPGPRMVASSAEFDREALPSGALAIADHVRLVAKDGYGSLKFALSGFDGFVPGSSRVATYSQEEVTAIGETAKELGVSLACHVQAGESVIRAARGGFRVLYHCTYADEEGLDAMEARKDDIFFAPAVGLPYARISQSLEPEKSHDEAERYRAFSQEHLDRTLAVVSQARSRGICILPGGDYGFAHNPIGRNAVDIQLFVDLFGYSPLEALSAATSLGGSLMDLPVGEVKVGRLADLLLVKGDPTEDVTLLQDKANLRVVMKDGRLHKHEMA